MTEFPLEKNQHIQSIEFKKKIEELHAFFITEYEYDIDIDTDIDIDIDTDIDIRKQIYYFKNKITTRENQLVSLIFHGMNESIIKKLIELELTQNLRDISFKFTNENSDLLVYFPSIENLEISLQSELNPDLVENLNLSSLIIYKKHNISICNSFKNAKATLKKLTLLIDDNTNELTPDDIIFIHSFHNIEKLMINTKNIALIKLKNIKTLIIEGAINLGDIKNLSYLSALKCSITDNSEPLPNLSTLKKISIRKLTFDESSRFDMSLLKSNTLESIILDSYEKINIDSGIPNLKYVFFKSDQTSHSFDKDQILYNHESTIDFKKLLNLYSKLEYIKINGYNISNLNINKKYNNIRLLYLGYSNIYSLDFINWFPNLTSISLPGNRIQHLPHIINISKIKHLNLFNNEIMNIPKRYNDYLLFSEHYAGNKDNQAHMTLGLNPLINPSLEIIKRGVNAQKSYFKSMQGEIEELNEAKIIFLGPGSVGKTSLMKCLSGKPFDPQENTTHGINIQKYAIKLKNGSTINAKIWDFGGQQINHTTHQLFLSQRCVYVLVINDRINDEPQDQKIDYWLQQVKAFGGDSKVIIVRNKCEQFKHSNLQEGLLHSKFPNIAAIESVSCKENINIDLLRERLNNEVTKLPMRQMQIPKNWLEVKNEVQCIAEKLDHFSLTKFREICLKHHIIDDIAQQTLLDLLNDLSLIIVFPELAAYDMGVLNPYWITDGIYSIINCQKFEEQKGLVTQKEVQDLLDNVHPDRYKNKAKFIIDSLLKFELCHTVGTDTSNSYLVPSLLPPLDQKIELPRIGNTVNLIFSYENLLPKSIFTKFLVRMNKDISADCRWKSAAILADVSFNAKALVIEDDVNKTISVQVTGEQARDYFAVIRKTINDLNHPDAKKLGVKELVLLPNSNGASIPYAELLGYEAEGEETYLHGITRIRHNVSELLSGIESKQDTVKRVNELNRKEITVNVTNHVENNSNATVSNTSTQEQTQTTTQSVNITLDLQLFKGSAKNVIDDLKDDLLDEIEDEKTLRRATRECDKVQSAIDDIQDVSTPEEALAKASSFERLRNFFDGALKGNSSIGEHLKMLRETTGQVKEIAKKYNSIASYFGLPIVPEVLL